MSVQSSKTFNLDNMKNNLESLVYNTSKEFNSSSFANKIENLLTANWTERVNNFWIKTDMTPENDERVRKLMDQKFSRFG